MNAGDPTFARLPDAPLVLASESPTRARMLESAGVDFVSRPAGIDEVAVRSAAQAEGELTPGEVAVTLADMKARAVASKGGVEPGQLVLGVDQILAFDGEVFGKPESREQCAEQLSRLSGNVHALETGAVVLRDGQRIWHRLAAIQMQMRDLSEDEIGTYLDVVGEAAFWSPGSYQIEGAGAHLFTRIGGCHYTVRGLPLLELLAFLREHGLSMDSAGSKGAS